ncbi:hypothetical protein [Peptostreptococcus sp. D1]|uniref:hypothetical protein n=1 Tax=Peptostreptococcus sp. D1 TaxID=72304 RepID=UPI0008E73D4A|nr:hypothetical protein [Peptostreptococcus sp. D1]SFE54991.1 hypothetical protein SAMN02910278_01112 [Peptostreptococcus sp. D1]
MLGKLIKYEFRATARYFVPIFIAMILVFFINSLLVYANLNYVKVNDIVVGIMVAITFGVIIALSIIGIYVSAKRFAQGVFGDEGYLTNTLPVKAHEIIISKTIVMFLFQIFSFIVMIVSIGMIWVAIYSSLTPEVLKEFWNNLEQTYSYITSDLILAIVFFMLSMIISMISSPLLIFLCVSIGHLKAFVSHKYLVGILSYVIISISISVLRSTKFEQIFIGMNSTTKYVNPSAENSIELMVAFFNKLSIETIIQSVVLIAVCFAATQFIISRKLNLE